MIALVCGGRNYQNRGRVFGTLDRVHAHDPIDVLIEGGAQGADNLGKQWAKSRAVHCATVPALWDFFGPSAGPVRNVAMLKLKPDRVIAFPGDKGTAHCVGTARALGIPVTEVKDDEAPC